MNFTTQKSRKQQTGLTLKNRYRTYVTSFCIFSATFLLSLTVASLLAPVKTSDAKTETYTTENNHTVSVTMADDLSLDLTSTPDGVIAATTDNLSIVSDAPNGYQLYLSVSGADNNLVHTSDDTAYYSPAAGTFAAPAALDLNSWGYAIPLGSTGAPDNIAFDNSYDVVTKTSNFAAVPVKDEAQLLQQTSGPNETANALDITYAVTSNTAQKAGTYSATILYTVLADDPAPSIYMQDFTLAMCEALKEDEPLTLLDRRDDKTYTVARHKDGNCWMTENLRYDVAESTSWTTNDYSKSLLHIAENEGYKGEYYYNWPAALESCPNGWSLPVNGDKNTDKSYAKLLDAYSITTGPGLVAETKLGFTKYYGYWDWGQNSEYEQGSHGDFWASTPSSDARAYRLWYYNTGADSQGDGYKGNGFTVRCVFDHTSADEMQNFTYEMCQNLAEDTNIPLIDRRDGAKYTVVRAKDGNCWMTSNLTLINKTVSYADSDFPDGTFNVPATTTWNSNVTSSARVHKGTNSGYTDQVYYNWYAATAGSTAVSGNVNTSICPKGWGLPISGDKNTDKSWAKLLDAYGITTGAELLENDVLGFDDYYGYWNWGRNSEWVQGSDSYFWSSTPSSETNAYDLWYYSTGFNSQNSSYKGGGFSIRCVFKSTGTMQDFTFESCDALETGTTIILEDRRNGQDYSVLKAKDGNCWMTQNLALSGMTIKAEDSNFAEGAYDVPSSTTWNTNLYTEPRLHVAEKSGYEGSVYYNWTAAAALQDGSTTFQQNQSICPKNWRLPVNGDANTDKSYAKLLNSYGITTGSGLVSNADLGITKYYGGWYYGNNSESYQGTNGKLWSSTPTAASTAYALYYYDSTGAVPQNDNEKAKAYVIRCVFEDSRTLADISYLQDINASICQNTAEGYATTLLDKRGRGAGGADKTTGYGVVRAKDGNCWMTDNLDLYSVSGATVTATAADSDVPANFSLPTTSNWSSNIYNAAKLHVATNSGYAGEVYYNWCTAAALSSCSTTAQQNQSICPKNWRLPINGDATVDKSYAKLLDAYSVTTGAELLANDTLGFTDYYGYWDLNTNSEDSQGEYGHFWSSTPYSETNAYAAVYSSDEDWPQNGNRKGYGFSLRCVAR